MTIDEMIEKLQAVKESSSHKGKTAVMVRIQDNQNEYFDIDDITYHIDNDDEDYFTLIKVAGFLTPKL